MPKDFQISQYDLPTNVDGYLDLPNGKRVGIERAHIEEDTGKNTHVGGDGRIHGAEYSLVDYNRAGIPLVEIVSRPDLRSADDAKDYVNELRAILLATNVSDAKMEEGSMRVDANVSVRRDGDDELGTRCEIKNLNSVRSLVHAIEHEAGRQVELVTAGERVRQETRHWDEAAGLTRPGRSKEQAEDYRYFPEPDLVPLDPDAEYVARIAAALPLLPSDRRTRLASASNGSQGAVAIAVSRGLDDLALAAIEAGGDPGRVLTHIEHNLAVDGASELDPSALAALARMEANGALTPTQAKVVLAELVENGGDPEAIAKTKGFEAMDASALDASIDAAIAAEPEVWAKYAAGDDKAVGRLVGSVMKATNGQADGKAVTAKLMERRASASG
jgi:aspartyl-tRNA(Asn)/glutamyl-tRNA(Gln) amidotransferase subunit B